MDSIKGKDRAHDMKPQQDSKHRRSKDAKAHRGARRKGQMPKQRADRRSKKSAAQSLGNMERSPESWETKGEKKKHKIYNSEGKSLSKVTGKAKKPLTEVGKAAGGTDLG